MKHFYNEDLEIIIYKSSDPDTILQTSHFGDGAADYRITNFKTPKQPAEYTVEVRRIDTDFLIGSFTFKTVK